MIDTSQIANQNISQAAKLMGVSESTVKRRMREGLPFIKEPGSNRIKFSVSDIVEWQRQYRHVMCKKPEEKITTEKILEFVRNGC